MAAHFSQQSSVDSTYIMFCNSTSFSSKTKSLFYCDEINNNYTLSIRFQLFLSAKNTIKSKILPKTC